MSTNTRLLLSAIGVVALAATPVIAKTSHLRTYRSHTEQVAPQAIGSNGDYAYNPGIPLPRELQAL